MKSIIKSLSYKDLINPPDFVKDTIQYEVIMGSFAYGVSGDMSDVDVYGFCIPPKEYIFPHLRGEIEGFGTKLPRFEQFQRHHINLNNTKYDLSIYGIVKFFQLCMQNNPNMIDALFVPRRCILYKTKIADLILENRRIFLHKGSWHRFKGYAYSSLKKCKFKKLQGYDEIFEFENNHNIPHETTKEDVLNEIKNRGLE